MSPHLPGPRGRGLRVPTRRGVVHPMREWEGYFGFAFEDRHRRGTGMSVETFNKLMRIRVSRGSKAMFKAAAALGIKWSA